ncbi:MAG: hypothetical protein AMJ93_16825, partial [Anaerolineae bacterium SM23_84]
MRRLSTAVFIVAAFGLAITLLFLGGTSAEETSSGHTRGAAVSATEPSEHVVVFQEGSQGYSGVEDTYIY